MKNTISQLRLVVMRVGRMLIRLAMDAELRRDLNRIYERLDSEMPNLLKETKPVQMTGSIASAIADVTGHKATADRIDAVVALYNPIAATIRNLR
jgi:hypothetical protein